MKSVCSGYIFLVCNVCRLLYIPYNNLSFGAHIVSTRQFRTMSWRLPDRLNYASDSKLWSWLASVLILVLVYPIAQPTFRPRNVVVNCVVNITFTCVHSSEHKHPLKIRCYLFIVVSAWMAEWPNARYEMSNAHETTSKKTHTESTTLTETTRTAKMKEKKTVDVLILIHLK